MSRARALQERIRRSAHTDYDRMSRSTRDTADGNLALEDAIIRQTDAANELRRAALEMDSASRNYAEAQARFEEVRSEVKRLQREDRDFLRLARREHKVLKDEDKDFERLVRRDDRLMREEDRDLERELRREERRMNRR